MNRSMMVRGLTLGLMMLTFALVGCGSSGTSKADRESKREQDRAAMRMADAERDRDVYKSQIDTLKANVAQATEKQRNAEAQLSRVQQELAAARAGQTTAEQQAAQLAAAQKQLTDSQQRIKEMQIQIDALKTSVTPSNPTPSTPPTPTELNK